MILGVDPKVDYAFKKVFGSESHVWVLIDLLNAVLGSTIPEPITEVELRNPFNDKESLDDKLSIFDIKARDGSGRWYNIEMQMAAFEFYPKRVLYYWSRLYHQQLKEGIHYRELRPAISISFVNGILLPGSSYHQEFGLVSRHDSGIVFCSDLSIHLIELPKFTHRSDNLTDSLEPFKMNFRST